MYGVMSEEERRRALANPATAKLLKGKEQSSVRLSQHQIIEDKVIDMLIFLTFRFTKAFERWKATGELEAEESSPSPIKRTETGTLTENQRSVRFGDMSDIGDSPSKTNHLDTLNLRSKNLVIKRMARLLRSMVHELHSYQTPMAAFVPQIVDYIVKFYAGEEYELGSDQVLKRTSTQEPTLKDFLKERTFFQKDCRLSEEFKSDSADKAWFLEQRSLSFLDRSNHWSVELYREASKVYKDAITESGMGQSCYPVLNDYLLNVTNSFEPSKIFSKQMSQLSLSFLIPMNRTRAYYNELAPLTECLSRLYSPDLEKAGKRCALSMIRSVFQSGSSDKIKVCLDMRVPKHVIHFLQDSDNDVRRECLLTLLEISKGLQDHTELSGKTTANLKQEYSRRGFKKTAFDQHKAISMANQSENVDMA
jgi:hypothetical protein